MFSIPNPRRGRGVTFIRCVLLGVLIGLVGCRSYRAEPLDPMEVAERLVERSRAAFVSERAGGEWFPLAAEVDVRDGLSLSEANTLALVFHPDVRHARHRAVQAGANRVQAGLLANPTVFAAHRWSLSSSNSISPITLSWRLPWFGQRAAKIERAEALVEEARLELVEAELHALVEVRKQAITIVQLERELDELRSVRESSERVIEWVTRLESAQEIDAVTSWLSRAGEEEMHEHEIEKRRQLAFAKQALFAQVGLLPTADVEPDLAEDVVQLPALPESSLSALRDHPHLQRAEAEYRRAEAQLRLAVSKQYPQLQIGPDFEEDNGQSFLGPGVQLSLPIFNRNQGGIAAAEEARDAARDHYRGVLLELAHREARARTSADTHFRILQLHSQERAKRVARARDALESRLRLGVANVAEIVEAQRSLAHARLHDFELEAEYAHAVLDAAAAGGIALVPPIAESEEGE